jgi:hypothetical protein
MELETNSATWTGGCLCGAIRYEASVTDSENWYCHCRMCQRWTGSVLTTSAIIPKADLRITKGEPKYYRSSSFVERGFCQDCASPLFFRPIKDDWVSIQTGTLDNPELAPPKGHYGVEGRVSWLKIDDKLPSQRTEDDEWFQERSSEQDGV